MTREGVWSLLLPLILKVGKILITVLFYLCYTEDLIDKNWSSLVIETPTRLFFCSAAGASKEVSGDDETSTKRRYGIVFTSFTQGKKSDTLSQKNVPLSLSPMLQLFFGPLPNNSCGKLLEKQRTNKWRSQMDLSIWTYQIRSTSKNFTSALRQHRVQFRGTAGNDGQERERERERESGKSMLTIFINPSTRAWCNTRSICKRSLTGLNSEFSFS